MFYGHLWNTNHFFSLLCLISRKKVCFKKSTQNASLLELKCFQRKKPTKSRYSKKSQKKVISLQLSLLCQSFYPISPRKLSVSHLEPSCCMKRTETKSCYLKKYSQSKMVFHSLAIVKITFPGLTPDSGVYQISKLHAA